jgi:hypothetical protein
MGFRQKALRKLLFARKLVKKLPLQPPNLIKCKKFLQDQKDVKNENCLNCTKTNLMKNLIGKEKKTKKRRR